jgi:hypothetical protein
MHEIFQAKYAFATMHGKERVHVGVGDTVAAGHWLLDTNGDAFAPLQVKFDVPAKKPTAKP